MMEIKYNHQLPAEEAYKRIDGLLSALQRQYADKISNPQGNWNSDHTLMEFSVDIMGFNTQGQVSLRNGQVTLDGKLPFMAKMFSGKIEGMIRQKLDEILS